MNPVNQMHAEVITYFGAEKRESLLFMAAGVLAILASVYLMSTGSPYRGMAYPLITIALIQLVVGGTVYFRTDAQTRALHAQLQKDPGAYAGSELPRMETVQRNFKLYRTIEIALIVAGVAGVVFFRERETLYAVSLGLVLQAGLMLSLDLVAERRAHVYIGQIRSMIGALEGTTR